MMPIQCGTQLPEVHARPRQDIAHVTERSIENGLYGVETNRYSQDCGDRLFSVKTCSIPVILIDQFRDIFAGPLNTAATLSFVSGNKERSKGLSPGDLQEFDHKNIRMRAEQSFKAYRFPAKRTFLRSPIVAIWHIFIIGTADLNLFSNENVRRSYTWGALASCILLLAGAVCLPGLAKKRKLTDPGWQGWPLVIGMSMLPRAFGWLINSTGLQSRIIRWR
jgi:hypothetical protein